MKTTTWLKPIFFSLAALGVTFGTYAHNEKKSSGLHSMPFVENKGQIIDQNGKQRRDIDFSIQQQGFNVYVGSGSFHYQWLHYLEGDKNNCLDDRQDIYRMDVVLLGANKDAKIIKQEEQSAYIRYYLPQTERGSVAHSYGKIIYKDVYPHIDWVLYASAGKKSVKYDFIVHPGGKVSDIKLQYNGAGSMQLSDGKLHVANEFGKIEEAAPYTYLVLGNNKINLSSKYVLKDNVLSFDVEGDAGSGDIVIDPTVAWSTYFGGTNYEFGASVVTDTSGNAYLCGNTSSTSNIATSGSYLATLAGNKDGFLAKFDDAGNLQWATYYGGSANDNFFYLAADTLNNIYACGITASTSGIATSTAQQTSFGGGNCDAYLVKFTTSGTVTWATYYGGTDDEGVLSAFDDYMVGVAWDHATNSVFLCGNTLSNGLATSSAYQTSRSGNSDGYLARFSAAGVLQWSTYYGGSSDDKITKAACDGLGNVYITGETQSSSGIASSTTVQQNTYGGSKDAFVARFSSTGTLSWSTYLGGSSSESAVGIATDITGAVYVAGTTQSSTGIATTGVFQPTINGSSSDAFLVKYNPTGVRAWGTYFGGTSADQTADIAIDATGNVCFSGTTASSGLATMGAYQFNFAGSTDAFLAIFSPGGQRSWVTYLGGSDVENGFGVNYSRLGDLFMAGNSNSSTAMATGGAYQMSLAGSQDAYVTKFKADTSVFIVVPFTPTIYCAGDSMFVPYGITNPFLPGNVFSIELSDANGFFGSPVTIGSATTVNPGTLACKIPSGTTPGTAYRIRVKYTHPAGNSYDNGSNLTVKLLPSPLTLTSNTPICSGTDLTFSATTTTSNVVYSWTGPGSFTSTTQSNTMPNAQPSASGYYVAQATLNGCTIKDSVNQTVNLTPIRPVPVSNSPVCLGNTINLTSTSSTPGVNYTWKGPGSFTSNTQSTSRSGATTAMAGYYVSTAVLGMCSSKDSIAVVVQSRITPDVTTTIVPGANLCIGDTAYLWATGINGGTAPSYQWYVNNVPIPGSTNSFLVAPNLANGDTLYCIYTSSAPCVTKPTDTSLPIYISVSGPVKPIVTLTATPGLNVYDGDPITFIANPTYGGNKPKYAFYVNGNLVQAYSFKNFYLGVMGYDFKTGDSVSCCMNSDLSCSLPHDACSPYLKIGKHIVVPSSVSNVNVGDALTIYPNPNNGNFTLKGTVAYTGEMDVDVVNALGQVLFTKRVKVQDGEVNASIYTGELPAGVYTLRVKAGDASQTLRLVVNGK
ncbi:MAG: SBBP repeat-containing protein [Bacteroidetes bacterium]|nr:SBBP repeat-containing protein [Bacteroidota bacterium]